MSYATMDHAGWVESNNAATNRQWAKSTAKRKPKHLPETLNESQRRAVDILGITFGGIYNAPINWDKAEWMDRGVIVTLTHDKDMGTYDFNTLTMFVLLCHAARMRGDISRGGGDFRGGMMISLHARTLGRNMVSSHPDIGEAVAAFEHYIPADHRIRWREYGPETVTGAER